MTRGRARPDAAFDREAASSELAELLTRLDELVGQLDDGKRARVVQLALEQLLAEMTPRDHVADHQWVAEQRKRGAFVSGVVREALRRCAIALVIAVVVAAGLMLFDGVRDLVVMWLRAGLTGLAGLGPGSS